MFKILPEVALIIISTDKKVMVYDNEKYEFPTQYLDKDKTSHQQAVELFASCTGIKNTTWIDDDYIIYDEINHVENNERLLTIAYGGILDRSIINLLDNLKWVSIEEILVKGMTGNHFKILQKV